MKHAFTIWERKIAQAIAYLEQHDGNEQAAFHQAAKNNEQIDDAQWAKAIRKYNARKGKKDNMLTIIEVDAKRNTIFARELEADAASAPEDGAVLPGGYNNWSDQEIRDYCDENLVAPWKDIRGTPYGDYQGFKVERE